MATRQRRRLLNIEVTIDTPVEKIKPIKYEKLLGIIIQDDLKWSEFIHNNDNCKYLSNSPWWVTMFEIGGDHPWDSG